MEAEDSELHLSQLKNHYNTIENREGYLKIIGVQYTHPRKGKTNESKKLYDEELQKRVTGITKCLCHNHWRPKWKDRKRSNTRDCWDIWRTDIEQ